MKTFRSVFALFGLACLAVSSPAATMVVEAARVHTAAGANGCTVSGVTVATPAVVTCAAAHNLRDGDQVQVTGVNGTTTVNTLAYVKVSTYSATTFAMFSDTGLSVGITGTGAYTSGGQVTEAVDISGLTGDFTLTADVDLLTLGSKVLLAVQDSADGFVNDIKTLAVVNLTGAVALAAPLSYTWRGYDLPSIRLGLANGRIRMFVQSIDSSSSVTTSLFVSQ